MNTDESLVKAQASHSLWCRVVIGVLLAANAPVASGAVRQRLLGYYMPWPDNGAGATYAVDTIPYAKLTHLVYAFVWVDLDGHLHKDERFLHSKLVSLAHAANVKVMVSVGGYGIPGLALPDGTMLPDQEKAFAAVAGDEGKTRRFVQEVYNFAVANRYDGVDIDWEVPEVEDAENCLRLMTAIRAMMPHGKFLISMAIGADPRVWGRGFDVAKLAPVLDFINVMTYGFHGETVHHTGHNSPLFWNKDDPCEKLNIRAGLAPAIDLYTNTYKVPREKLNVGTAFYGRRFVGTSSLWNSYSTGDDLNYGSGIKPLLLEQRGWQKAFDKVAQAPYLVFAGATPAESAVVTYDDPGSTARKVRYVLGERKMGGVFVWRLGGDYDGTSQELLDAMRRAFLRFGH